MEVNACQEFNNLSLIPLSECNSFELGIFKEVPTPLKFHFFFHYFSLFFDYFW